MLVRFSSSSPSSFRFSYFLNGGTPALSAVRFPFPFPFSFPFSFPFRRTLHQFCQLLDFRYSLLRGRAMVVRSYGTSHETREQRYRDRSFPRCSSLPIFFFLSASGESFDWLLRAIRVRTCLRVCVLGGVEDAHLSLSR